MRRSRANAAPAHAGRLVAKDHPEAHVERAVHLVVGDAAATLDLTEDRRHLPLLSVEHGAEAVGQAAGQVAEDAASGDMRRRFPAQRSHGVEVGRVRGKQLVGKLLGQRRALEHLARERVAIGVQAVRRKSDQQVPFFDRDSIGAGIDHPDDEPRQVVVTQRVHAWHLRGLAAQQRASGCAARLGHAFDQLLEHRRLQLAGREIVEEEQRSGTRARDVVDAVVDDVDADAAMPSGGDCDLDLRADAVGAGRQPAAVGQLIKTGERTDARGHLRALGRGDQRLDPLQHALVRLDVDARRGVRKPFRRHSRGRLGPARTGTCPSRAAAARRQGTSRRSTRGRTPAMCRGRWHA